MVTLRAARINRNLTTKEVAKTMNISIFTLRNWECGRTFPNWKQLKQMEKLYHVKINDLIFLDKNNG